MYYAGIESVILSLQRRSITEPIDRLVKIDNPFLGIGYVGLLLRCISVSTRPPPLILIDQSQLGVTNAGNAYSFYKNPNSNLEVHR